MERHPADEQHVKGAGKKAGGGIMSFFGKLFGNRKMEAKGEAAKAEGTAREAVGDVKSAFKDPESDENKH